MALPPAQQGQRGPGNRLHDAAYTGSVELTTALLLLSSGLIDIDEGDPMGWTPLMCAVERGHLPVVSVLLSNCADVAIAADGGFTALLIAAQRGHLAIAKMLMKAGADIETASSQGATPLHVAAYNGHSEVMRALIQADANPNSRVPGGETPLYLAARRGFMEAVRELLRAEANPLLTWRHQSGRKWLPLHAAAEEGHSEVVRELIHEFGIEGCCGERSDAVEVLCLAAREGHVDIMAMLMEAGVIDTGEGLVLAAAANGPEASVKLLLEQQKGKTTGGSAYVNFRDSDGETPLLCSIVYCHSSSPRVARLLIDAGADTISKVRSEVRTINDDLVFEGTPLAVTNQLLRDKLVMGEPATEGQLHNLEAVRRLLLQVEAVHAVSWLWPSGITFITHAAEAKIRAKIASTPLTVMLPILRQRARRRGVLLSALFRYSRKP